jgi:hypothetical protein
MVNFIIQCIGLIPWFFYIGTRKVCKNYGMGLGWSLQNCTHGHQNAWIEKKRYSIYLESNQYMNKSWIHEIHYGLEKSYHPYNIFYTFSWNIWNGTFLKFWNCQFRGFVTLRSYFVILFTNLEVWTIERFFFCWVFTYFQYSFISHNVLALICTLHISILVWPKSNWKYSFSFYFWEEILLSIPIISCAFKLRSFKISKCTMQKKTWTFISRKNICVKCVMFDI